MFSSRDFILWVPWIFPGPLCSLTALTLAGDVQGRKQEEEQEKKQEEEQEKKQGRSRRRSRGRRRSRSKTGCKIRSGNMNLNSRWPIERILTVFLVLFQGPSDH